MPRRGRARAARTRRAAAGRRRRRHRQRRTRVRHRHFRRGGTAGSTTRTNPRSAVVGLLVLGVCTICIGLVLSFSVSSTAGIGPFCVGGVSLLIALLIYAMILNRPVNRTVEVTATEQVTMATRVTAPAGIQQTTMVITPYSTPMTHFVANALAPGLVDNRVHGSCAPYPTAEPHPPPHETPPPSYEDVV